MLAHAVGLAIDVEYDASVQKAVEHGSRSFVVTRRSSGQAPHSEWWT
jgi:hypothetical protein